jgi:hypothetical protein
MEAGSGHEDSSHNILTLDALQVLSRSQVTWVVNVHARPICKSTYIPLNGVTEVHHDALPAAKVVAV